MPCSSGSVLRCKSHRLLGGHIDLLDVLLLVKKYYYYYFIPPVRDYNDVM